MPLGVPVVPEENSTHNGDSAASDAKPAGSR